MLQQSLECYEREGAEMHADCGPQYIPSFPTLPEVGAVQQYRALFKPAISRL